MRSPTSHDDECILQNARGKSNSNLAAASRVRIIRMKFIIYLLRVFVFWLWLQRMCSVQTHHTLRTTMQHAMKSYAQFHCFFFFFISLSLFFISSKIVFVRHSPVINRDTSSNGKDENNLASSYEFQILLSVGFETRFSSFLSSSSGETLESWSNAN